MHQPRAEKIIAVCETAYPNFKGDCVNFAADGLRRFDALPAHQLPDAERYEHTFRGDVQHARRQRSDKLRKTRFGMDL
jgi:hypothetical protein